MMDITIKTFMLEGLKLTSIELLVYALIYTVNQTGQPCTLSKDDMALQLNTSNRTVYRAVDHLKSRNLIFSDGKRTHLRVTNSII